MGSRLRAFVVAALLVAALAGCSGDENDSESADGWTGYAPVADGATACGSAGATPIGVLQARTALRRHGFLVRSDVSGPCPDGLAAVLESRQQDFDDDGRISCFLHAKPPANAPKRVAWREVDGADAELRLRNLTCTIFTDSPTGEEKIDRLEAAFAELGRATRP